MAAETVGAIGAGGAGLELLVAARGQMLAAATRSNEDIFAGSLQRCDGPTANAATMLYRCSATFKTTRVQKPNDTGGLNIYTNQTSSKYINNNCCGSYTL